MCLHDSLGPSCAWSNRRGAWGQFLWVRQEPACGGLTLCSGHPVLQLCPPKALHSAHSIACDTHLQVRTWWASCASHMLVTWLIHWAIQRLYSSMLYSPSHLLLQSPTLGSCGLSSLQVRTKHLWVGWSPPPVGPTRSGKEGRWCPAGCHLLCPSPSCQPTQLRWKASTPPNKWLKFKDDFHIVIFTLHHPLHVTSTIMKFYFILLWLCVDHSITNVSMHVFYWSQMLVFLHINTTMFDMRFPHNRIHTHTHAHIAIQHILT